MINNKILDVPINDYEKLRSNLCIRINDRKTAKDYLNDKVYTNWGAFAATYHILAYSQNDMAVLISVSPQMLDTWKIDTNTLHQDALKSMKATNPPIVENLDYFFSDAVVRPRGVSDMVVISAMIANYGTGAAYVTDPEVLTNISERFGGNYYLLPSSIYEMFAVPADRHNTQYLSEMVYRANRDSAVISPSDVLSDIVHLYDRSSGKLIPCEAYRPELNKELHIEKTPAKRIL